MAKAQFKSAFVVSKAQFVPAWLSILPINVTGEIQFSGTVTRKRRYKRNIGGSI